MVNTHANRWRTGRNSGNDDHKFGSRLSMTNGNGVVFTDAYRTDDPRLKEVTATLLTGYTLPRSELHLRQGRQWHVAAERRPAAGHELRRRAVGEDLNLR